MSSLTMSSLALRLLGPPQLERDGVPLHITRRRTLAFTIYLAVTGEPHHRDALTAFFWPELDVTYARADLRRTIYQVHAALGDEWLISEDDTLHFRRTDETERVLWLDIDAFHQRLAACHTHGHAHDEVCPDCLQPLADAVALYRNDFLAGFSLPDSPAFDDWQFFQGETLRNELASALARLVEGHAAQDAYPTAIAYARRWLALDPLHEPVHRWLMQLYAWNDQQAAALRQYQQCVQLLQEELATTPDPATEQLYQAIRLRRFKPLLTRHPHEHPATDHAPPAPTPPEDDIRVVTVVSVGLVETPLVADQTQAEKPLTATVVGAFNARPESTFDDRALDPMTFAPSAPDVDLLNRVAAASTQLLVLAEAVGSWFGGQVEQVVGEDILLLFGTVHVHEDDAERAVRAAWALRRQTEQTGLPVHIGISTGMAYCRHSPTGEIAILGPTVDWATRLRNRAHTGEILVNRNSYLATRGVFVYTAHKVALSGMTEPSSVYQVEGLRLQPHKARGIEGLHAVLVGRDRELVLLHAALTKAERGEGQVVTVVGTAGVGKSRLVSELKGSAPLIQTGVDPTAKSIRKQLDVPSPVSHLPSPIFPLPAPPLWLEGRGIEFAGTVPYWLFADLLRGYIGHAKDDPSVAFEHALVTMLRQLEAAGHLSESTVKEIAPLLAQLLSVQAANGWHQQLHELLPPQQIHRRMAGAVRQFIAALTQVQPVVLLFEDLHWADTHSLDLIHSLLDLLPEHRLLLLCLYRPEQAQASHQLDTVARQRCPERLTTLQLHELSLTESRQLVTSLLATDRLPEPVREQLLAKAAGNPFFLEEIVRSLIDRGLLYRDGDSWRAQATMTMLPIPENLQSLILSRVDHLTADAQLVLQMTSVLGRLFQSRVAAAMAPAELDLDAALSQLTTQAFIYHERTVPEAEYSFRHVLLRDAIYQDLPTDRRATFHAQAAHALEQLYQENLEPVIEQLAYHYTEAGVAEKAVPYLLQAGQKAARNYANEAALTYYTQAQELLSQQKSTNPRWQLAVLDGIGGIYATLGNLQQGELYLRQAIALAERLALPTVEQIRRYFPLCHLLGWHGRNDAVLALADAGLAMLGTDIAQPEAVMLITLKSDVYFNRGQHRAAMALIAQIIEILPQLAYMRQLQSAYNMAAMWSRYTKQIDEGFALLRTIEETALAHHDLWTIGYLHGWPVLFLYETIGELEQAIASLQRVEEIATQTGDELLRIQAHTYRGAIHGWCEGNWTLAADYAQKTIRLTESADVPRKSVFAYVTLGLAHYSHHAWHDAAATLEIARKTALAQQFRADCARRGDIGLAWSYLQLGRRDEAATLFHEVVAEEEADIESLHLIACALAGLAAAVPDPVAFQHHCAAIEAARSDSTRCRPLQWQAQPAEHTPGSAIHTLRLPQSAAELVDQGWQWVDPSGTGTYTFDDGLTITAANYRDLWLNNLGAPRLLHAETGSVALEVHCSAVCPERPALGGLLLWKNSANYLRLSWNTHGPGEINLLGCIDNHDRLFGRGAFPGAQQVTLRLERINDQVRALVCTDREQWFSIGTVEFPVRDPIQIGLVAIGFIPRYVYSGSYQEGTAIHFGS